MNVGQDTKIQNNALQRHTTSSLLLLSSSSFNESHKNDMNRDHDHLLQEEEQQQQQEDMSICESLSRDCCEGSGGSSTSTSSHNNSSTPSRYDDPDHCPMIHWDDIVWIGFGTLGGMVIQYLWSHIILFSFAWYSSSWSSNMASLVVFVLLGIKCIMTNYVLCYFFVTNKRTRIKTTTTTTTSIKEEEEQQRRKSATLRTARNTNLSHTWNNDKNCPKNESVVAADSAAATTRTRTTTRRDCCIIDDNNKDNDNDHNEMQFQQDIIEGFLLGMIVTAVALDAYLVGNYSSLFP